MVPDVFLGGTCGSSTWRRDIAIPILEDAHITYYDPQYPGDLYDTTSGAMATEDEIKFQCPYLLMVISGDTRGTATVTETVEFICFSYPVYIFVEDMHPNVMISGMPLLPRDIRDANRQRAFLRRIRDRRWPELPFYDSIEDAVRAIVSDHAAGVSHALRG